MSDPARDPFVGRHRELATLRAAFSSAAGGRGRIVLLAGEPGIGKTRTAEEFIAWARGEGAEVFVGRCYEGAGAPAFWPWIQVLRGYAATRDAGKLAAELGSAAADVAAVVLEVRAALPDLPPAPVLGPEHARFRFFDGVSAGLGRAASIRPVVLFLDDLHGADEPSLLLLEFLAREAHRLRLLIVAAYRDVAVAPGDPLARTLAELVREQVSDRLQLDGLATDEVEELMTSIAGVAPALGVAAAVRERTDGNPLYVKEVTRSLGGAAGRPLSSGALVVPESVRIAIGWRLEGLAADSREALAIAGIFGREFDAGALAQAAALSLSRPLAVLDEAAATGVVGLAAADPGRWRFTHALVAEVLAASIPVGRRVALHRRVAEAIAADPHAAERAAEIAHHWLAAGPAGDPEQAVAWGCRAGERALALLAYEEAARLYRAALKALGWIEGGDVEREAEILLALGEAHKRGGEHDEAKAVFERAAGLARRLGSAHLLTRAALGFAPAISWAERPEPDPAVMNLLEEACAAWKDADSALHARTLARLGMAHIFGDTDRRWSLLDRAVAMARRADDPATLRYVLACKLFGRRRLDTLGEDLATAGELIESAERAGDTGSLVYGRLARGSMLLQQGNLIDGDREKAAFTLLAADLGQPVWIWLAETLAAIKAIRDGRFDDAERKINQALVLGQTSVPYAAASCFAAASVLLNVLRGRLPESMATWRTMAEAHPDPAAPSPLAWAESELGDHAEARRLVERLVPRLGTVRDTMWLLSTGFFGMTTVNTGDRESAATLYEMLAPYDHLWVEWADVEVLWPVALPLGGLARVLERWEDAVTHLDAALEAATAARARPLSALSRYEYALVLRQRGAQGDATRAAGLLAEARDTAERLGMAGLLAKIARLGDARPASVGAAGGSEPTASQPPPREPPRAAAEARSHVFRRDGDYWTVGFDGKTVRLRDMRGFHYLAQLLRAPGRDIHASDLLASHGGLPNGAGLADDTHIVIGLGDAGRPLDARARAAYRQRLADLREELAEAEGLNDLGRKERASAEIAALRAALAESARRHGMASHGERSRLAVTKGIKAALARLGDSHPALAAHLNATVRRGYFCVYLPDPRHPITWET